MTQLTIKSEQDVIRVLLNYVNGDRAGLDRLQVKFDGWPHMSLRLEGDKYQQTVTPAVADFYKEIQKAVSRTYALITYGVASSSRITDEERYRIELPLTVGGGSSMFSLQNLQSTIEALFANMTGKQKTILCLAALLFVFGREPFNNYLALQKDKVSSNERIAGQQMIFEFLQKIPQRNPDVSQIIDCVVREQPDFEKIKDSSDKINHSILRCAASSTKATFHGQEISAQDANILLGRVHEAYEDIELAGFYRVARFSISGDTVRGSFKVRLKSIDSGETIDAGAAGDLTSKNMVAILRAAIEGKTIELEIKARKSASGDIKKAVVSRLISVEPAKDSK